MRKLRWMAVVTVVMLVAGSVPASMITLVEYDFETTTYGDADTFTSAASTVNHGEASAVSWVGDVNVITGGGGNVVPNENHTISQNGTMSEGTFAGSEVRVTHDNPVNWGINITHYFSFMFKAEMANPVEDYLVLDQFSLDFAHMSTNTGKAGHRGFEVQYSIAGNIFDSAGWGRLQGHPGSSNQHVNFAFELGGVELHHGEEVEFRIFKTNESGNRDEVRYDNFNLSGTVIPEPGTIGLLGLAGLAVLLRRRFRKIIQ